MCTRDFNVTFDLKIRSIPAIPIAIVTLNCWLWCMHGSWERNRQLLCTCCRRRGYTLSSQGEEGMEPKDRYNLVYFCATCNLVS